MVKIPAARADAFASRPDSGIKAVLLYGPDEGAARARALALTAAVAGSPADPYRVFDLSPSRIKDEPALVADECAALSFGGGRRVVRIAGLTEALAGPVVRYAAAPTGDSLLIVTADNLTPRSKLRAAFEDGKEAAAIPCYALEGRALAAELTAALAARNLRLADDAFALFLDLLGRDTAALRAEVDKLSLYMLSEPGTVTAADVMACCGDQSVFDAGELAAAAATGRTADTQRISDRLFAEGLNPVAMVRGLTRHFERLLSARGAMDKGADAETAIRSLRPPLFFRDKPAFCQALSLWRESDLMDVLSRLLDAECAAKSTGIPAACTVQRAAMEIASRAARRGRRR